MEVSRNSGAKKSPLRTKTFNNKPNDNILWIFLLDLLMKPQFEQYIRWTGKDLEFIIINGFVVFTEFQQRKWFCTEPTPLGEDPGVRWSNGLVDKIFVKERMRGLSLEYYNHKDEPERTDKPWIKKIKGMIGGYSFTTSRSICMKLKMPIEQLLKYARDVGSKYDYPKIGSIRNNKTKKSKNGSNEKTENKKINGKKSTSVLILLEQQYVGSHPSPPNFGIGTPPESPEGQLSQNRQLISEQYSPQNWNIADISKENVNFEPKKRFLRQLWISNSLTNFDPHQTQLPEELECSTSKINNLEESAKLSGNILKRKVGIRDDEDQFRRVDCHMEPRRKKIKETLYTTTCNIPDTQFRPPFIYSNDESCPVSDSVEQLVLPGWNYDITDKQNDFCDSQLNPRYGPVSSFQYDVHLLQPIAQNHPNLITGVVYPHHNYNSVINQSSNQPLTNETNLGSSPIIPVDSTNATGVLCELSPSDISACDNLTLEQCSHTEPPSQPKIYLNLQGIEDWDVVSVEELYQYLFD